MRKGGCDKRKDHLITEGKRARMARGMSLHEYHARFALFKFRLICVCACRYHGVHVEVREQLQSGFWASGLEARSADAVTACSSPLHFLRAFPGPHYVLTHFCSSLRNSQRWLME